MPTPIGMPTPLGMFTPKRRLLLAAVLLAAGTLLAGCEKSLDSPEYGEIIDQVPPELNRPFPLPQLDEPGPSPLAGPAPIEESGEQSPKENAK